MRMGRAVRAGTGVGIGMGKAARAGTGMGAGTKRAGKAICAGVGLGETVLATGATPGHWRLHCMSLSTM